MSCDVCLRTRPLALARSWPCPCLWCRRTLLDPWAAQHGLQILLAPADNVAKCLAEAGVLQESVDGPPLLQLSMYKRILKEIAYVWVLDADTVQCTCRFFSLHTQCEHLLFARTQSWPGRPADLCFEVLLLARPPASELEQGPRDRWPATGQATQRR